MNQEVPINETPEEKRFRLIQELHTCEMELEKEPENPELLFQKGFIWVFDESCGSHHAFSIGTSNSSLPNLR